MLAPPPWRVGAPTSGKSWIHLWLLFTDLEVCDDADAER